MQRFITNLNEQTFFYWKLLNITYVIWQNGKQMVQEGALTALASVADSSQVFYNSSLVSG